MISNNTPIAVTMTAEMWNQAIDLMREAPVPHRVSDPVIREIYRQCMAIGEGSSQQEADNTQRLRQETNSGANGEDVDNVQQH
jgi:hypothetical protein